jgi:SWI/SNF-related matrix-associated actin-dependent regulator 1 of chromatin subfamily A
MDFYNLLRLIKSPLVDNWKFYAQRYCEGKQITTRLKNGKLKKVWITNGASNLDELSIKTRNLLLRRMKNEVLDMPEKTIIPNYYKLNSKQWAEYESLWEDYLIERKKQKKRGGIQRDLVELGLLRKYIAMQTIPQTTELVDEIIEQGHKVIIFTCFTDELRELENYYGKNCVTHFGEMNEKDKQKSVDRFQQDGGPMVFIGNIISAGVAITLTKSPYVVFNSFDWVPGNSEQAEDRSYRLGQRENVTVYYNLFSDTVVTKMWYTLKRKKDIINQIMSANENMSDVIENVVDYIIEDKND